MVAPIKAKQVDTTNGSISSVSAGDSATEGTGSGVARRDHQHSVDTGAGTAAVDFSTGALEGSGTDLARVDHAHDLTETGTISTINGGDAGVVGTAAGIARKDHQHAVATAAAGASIGADNTSQEGSSSSLARADHDHDVETGTAVELTDSTNAEGTGDNLARASHTHAHGNRGGGTLHAAVTTGTNGFMISTDKAKLDGLSSAGGFSWKDSVRAATDAPGTLATDFENGDTIDTSVTLATGDRILIKNQASGIENGIYIVKASGAPDRAGDLDTGDNAAGAACFVEEGTANADRGFTCNTDGPNDVVGTDALTFVEFTGCATITAGTGMTKTGSTLNVNAHADGSIIANADDMQVGVLATDGQHGNLGGGALHADVVPAGADGFMTGADKTKLDNIETAATANVPRQEIVATEAITGTDTALTDTLNNTPISNASLVLKLNGVDQRQGVGADYTVSGQTITWLANTGTAVDMETSDTLDAVYQSAA